MRRAGERQLDEERRDPRRVDGGRDEVGRQPVVEVSTAVELHLLDRRVPDGLQRAALDLARGEHRVHDAPELVDRDDGPHGDLAGVDVHVHLGDGRRPAVRRVGVTAVAGVVPHDPRVAGEPLVDPDRPVRRGPGRKVSANEPARLRLDLVAQPARRGRRAARRRSSSSGRRPSGRCPGRATCPSVTTSTTARSRRRASRRRAATRTVRAPWPISVDAVRTRRRASAVSSRPATLARRVSPLPVNPAPCQPSASPTPAATGPPCRTPCPALHTPRGPASGPDPLVLRGLDGPVEHLECADAVAQPLTGRRRVARHVRPPSPERRRARRRARSAIRFTCVSTANSTCGAPKPRKAPFGGVFVAIVRARIRTFGQAYGPAAWIAPRDRTTGESVP